MHHWPGFRSAALPISTNGQFPSWLIWIMPLSMPLLAPRVLPLTFLPSGKTRLTSWPALPETCPAVSTCPSLLTMTPLPELGPTWTQTTQGSTFSRTIFTWLWIAFRSSTFSGTGFTSGSGFGFSSAAASKATPRNATTPREKSLQRRKESKFRQGAIQSISAPCWLKDRKEDSRAIWLLFLLRPYQEIRRWLDAMSTNILET